MKWNEDNPVNVGPYLCAVKGYDKPLLLFWQKSLTTCYWSLYNNNPYLYEHNKYEVLYYMNLSDIPMPEGW